MIRISQLQKQYPNKVIFDNANLHIKPDERIGLVGPNGTGKTTLLRMIAGHEQPDGGEISVRKSCTIGYLVQDVTEEQASSVLEEMLRGFPELAALEHELLELEARLRETPHDQALLKKYGQRREAFERLEGYQIESKAKAILSGVGFRPTQFAEPPQKFSGGWQMRLALAKLLLQQPQVLLLDEPTNHLDLESILWLEDFLINYDGTIVLISHDHYFLNRTVTRIVEIAERKLTGYPGTYDDYQAARALRHEQLAAAQKNQQKQIAQTERFIERFRYKATKARQVQSRIKHLEKIDRIELPEDNTPVLRFRFPQPERSGTVVAELNRIIKRYGDHLVYDNLNLEIERGEKMALIGPNGAGKSTLLKILAGAVDIQAGDIKFGHNVQRYYYAQHQLDILNAENTILQELASAAPEQSEQWLRQLAGTFLFPGDDVFKKIAVLSGGERARVALAKMLARPANFFILDEPTNHLDIQAREILQNALASFHGTIIFISHDRRFINALATSVIEVKAGKLRKYPGDYEYYQWKKKQEQTGEDGDAAVSQQAANATGPVAPKAAISKKDERRQRAQLLQERQRRLRPLEEQLTRLEAEIDTLEKQKKQLTDELCQPALLEDPPAYAAKARLLNDISRKLEAAMNHWAETSESLEAEKSLLQDQGLL